MFDRFTDRARKTLDRSWREARRLGHDYIGTEHFLLGLLDDDGVAGDILKELRVDLARLRAETMQYLTPGPAPIPERQIPFTPRAKSALELALEEANSLGHNYIGTEHLLLGLIREEEGVAAKALAGAGLRVEEVRKHMPPGSPTKQPTAPAIIDRPTAPARSGSFFDRFTDRARKVMGLALREALRFNQDYIGTEHMMLGLILEGSGVGADVLKNLDVDARRIRVETERLMTPGSAMITTGQLPFTQAAKRVLELTREAANGLGHDYMGTEHVLLGLIREEAGIAARVLAAHGVTYENARREVVELLGGPETPPVDTATRTATPPLHRPRMVPGMFDRFTDRARRVMGLSRQECQRFNHDYIGTEHILLALLLEGGGVAADVLKNLDVDPKRIRLEVERLIAPGTTTNTTGLIPFTPGAKKVLESALEEANNLGHNYIGTEHLFLGLIREEKGIAAQALRKLNVRVEDVREQVAELLGAEPSRDEGLAPEVPGLTDRARRVMRIARDEAARFSHPEIGTEHLLLGLIGEVAPGVLSKILLRRLRVDTEKLMTPGTELVAKGEPTFTPGARKAIELALQQARDLGRRGAGPEDLLLGLIREKEGIAARVLAAFEITADEVLDLVRSAEPDTRPAPSRSVFDRFADRSRIVLGLARQEAQRFNHDYIGTEHVLLGLVAERGGAADVLERLGLDPKQVRAETERRLTLGKTMVTTGQLPFTPAMKHALELALEEVDALGHDSIRTEHLVLGLIREEKGTAAQVLTALGVTYEAARREVVELLGPPSPPR